MTIDQAILPLLIFVPILSGLLIAFSPEKSSKAIATAGSFIAVAVYILAALRFQNWLNGRFGLSFTLDWFPPLGLRFETSVDSVSMMLIGLTVLLGPICVIGSFTAITQRLRTYYGWLMVLQGAMTGVFCSRDVILFYVFFEFTLVPMYVLINLYGSTNRKAAATKFFLFTFTGSIITLAGLVYVAYRRTTMVAGVPWTFSLGTLADTCRALPPGEQALVFWAMLCGFAVKVPLFPVHTWLPLAHTEAPTAGSVVLAGVLLKLGTYGLYRFALPFCPAAAIEYAPIIAGICIIGILYAGLICWVQTDVKKLVAYSSVSHLGFCVLGLFALNGIGLTGSVLYMLNHGLSTGALFLMIGMIYERYHTRNMRELGGLAKKMPIWATFMVIFTMASVGLPGTNGFVSEFMCLFGAFQAGGEKWAALGGVSGTGLSAYPGATYGNLGPWFAFIAGTGMIVTAMYLLYMLGKVVWGPLVEPGGHGGGGHGHGHDDAASHGPLPRDLSMREIGLLLPLAALCIGLGLYPAPLLHALEAPTHQTAALIQNTRDHPPEPKRTPNPTHKMAAVADAAAASPEANVIPASTAPHAAEGHQ
jgi:NADH-quinone oxidoreductase subunit M